MSDEILYVVPSWDEIWAALAKEPAPYTGPRVLKECPGCLEVSASYYQEGAPHNEDPIPCELCLVSDNVEALNEQTRPKRKASRKPRPRSHHAR